SGGRWSPKRRSDTERRLPEGGRSGRGLVIRRTRTLRLVPAGSGHSFDLCFAGGENPARRPRSGVGARGAGAVLHRSPKGGLFHVRNEPAAGRAPPPARGYRARVRTGRDGRARTGRR